MQIQQQKVHGKALYLEIKNAISTQIMVSTSNIIHGLVL